MDKTRKRTIVFSLLVTAGMLLPVGLVAQEGLFQRGDTDENNSAISLMNRSESTVGGLFTGQGFGATNGNITGQTFGAPLGSGIFVLLAAGAGYAAVKSRKKQTQNRKGK